MIVIGGEALVDLVDDGGSRRPVAGGGPFNTAIACGRLGLPVGFLGAISRDGFGEMLARQLAAAGVDMRFVCRSDAPTPRALVHDGDDGRNEYSFELAGTAFGDLLPSDLPVLPDEVWAVHVGTLALAIDPPAAAYEALVDRAVGRRKVVLDPNVRPAIFGDASTYRRRFERLAAEADVVKLSDDDAAWIFPGLDVDAVAELLLAHGPRVVAITRGSRGAVAAADGVVVEAAAVPVDVVDTVGAGDSFGAAFIAALVDQDAFGPGAAAPLDESVLAAALSYAVAAAAITCTRTGADPPTKADIAAMLRGDVVL